MTYSTETQCLIGGWSPKNGDPRTLPITQSTTYKYESSEHMARLFDLAEAGYLYSRIHNPTVDSAAAKICALEGGAAAMLTSSGQAASFFALFNICSAGDHFVCLSTIYGGTVNLFAVTMKRMGIDCTFVSPDAVDEELNAAFRPNTKAFFAESIANPAMVVLDFERYVAAAHAHGVPIIVDNTFPTPINCRPFEYGADIVTHSTTKYMDGHATCVGGAIVDSGNFDWEKYADKFSELTTPDESYHGVTYTRDFGKGAYITKAVVQLMRDLGAMPSPISAFMLNTHLESLAVRMERHCASAKKVAQFLAEHPKVNYVNYPGLEGDKYYQLAQKYMPKGTCGVINFGVAGGREKAAAFMDSLKLCYIATHVADARTCVLYPAGTTHRQLTDEQLEKAGVGIDTVRISVGLEDAQDIIGDIAQALTRV